MKIAVEGCAHGELELIYQIIQGIEVEQNIKVDLLICCGDFQATRNLQDLQTMAVPKKYRDMCSFYKYYSGELVAPMLTIFIGGNHEASNYLQELPYGGWVAPNIYYLGYAGVVRINGLRIAGISGIYKGNDYLRGRTEFSPYTDNSARSVYHVRQLEVFRLKQLTGSLDICISHDWPRGIYNYGNKAQLLRFKPHFNADIDSGQLGSRPSEELLHALKPIYWFAAHLHCKFAALVHHDETARVEKATDENDIVAGKTSVTKFLALDKCLPKRRFLQLLDMPTDNMNGSHADADADGASDITFEYDAEWLAILYLTNHLISVKPTNYYMPGPNGLNNERYNFTPTSDELIYVRRKFDNDLSIPKNFCRTVPAFQPESEHVEQHCAQPKPQINPQCKHFCDRLGIDDPLSLALLSSGQTLEHAEVATHDANATMSKDTSLPDHTSLESLNVSADTNITNANDEQNIWQDAGNPLKRRSLDIPAPNVKTTTAEQIDGLANVRIDTLLSTSPAEEAADSPAKPVSVVLISDIQEHNASPAAPKFKRRNQSIYTQDDDEVQT